MDTTLRSLFLYLLCATSAWAGEGILPQLPKAQITCDMQGDDAEYGLAVVSATLPDTKLMPGAPIKMTYYYNTPKGSSFLGDKSIALHRYDYFKKVPSDFEAVFGQLFVLKLKAGDYEMRGWQYGDGLNGTWSPTTTLEKIPFQVTAGRAVYLGSFEVALMRGENIVGQDVARAWPTLADRSQRDLSLLFQKCPAIDIMQVDVALLDLSPWLEKKQKKETKKKSK